MKPSLSAIFARSGLTAYLIVTLIAQPALAAKATNMAIAPTPTSRTNDANPGSDNAANLFARDLISPAGEGVRATNDFRDGSNSVGPGSEYISGYYNGAVLIPVTLIGAVAKPGVHHIPTRTNLLALLTYAGGATDKAKLNSVVIKRLISGDLQSGEIKEELINVDVQKMIQNPGSRGPLLQQHDVVVIPEKKAFIDQNTAQAIGFVSGLLGIVVSAIVIINYNKK